jgi:hypothetical protein
LGDLFSAWSSRVTKKPELTVALNPAPPEFSGVEIAQSRSGFLECPSFSLLSGSELQNPH